MTGQAIYYPTEREIAELNEPPSPRRNRRAKIVVISLGLFIIAVWGLSAISHEPPGKRDPINDRIQRRMMWPW